MLWICQGANSKLFRYLGLAARFSGFRELQVWRCYDMDKRKMAHPRRYCETCRFEISERAFKRHTLSVFHIKARLIRAMLERNCITHAEIARRIGVSRERVRQVTMQLGLATGRSRHALCRMERHKKEMAAFFLEAQKRGFAVELVGTKRGYINGKLCLQRQACWHKLEMKGHKYSYLSIYRPAGQFDICAWKLPDGRFLILPKKLVGFRQTSFKLEESERKGTASSAHYYREWIERWSELGRAGEAE